MMTIKMDSTGRGASILCCVSYLSGCAGVHYGRTDAGALEGKLVVEWREPNAFVFRPDLQDPLRFTRSTGETITPSTMWTDGGSIPRPFWAFRNFSPWGYGPAFIVHDWIFHMRDCELPGHDAYDLKSAAVIMSEVMKTLMEASDFDYGSPRAMYLMYSAVQSPPARNAWEDRSCRPVEEAPPLGPPDAIFEIDFSHQ